MKYTQKTLESLHNAINIAEVIGDTTTLKRSGQELKGLCPFHEERTPSLSVDEQQKLYHCFGCGAGGDAIRFVMDTEHLDFQGAVESLARRYNITLEVVEDDWQLAKQRRLYVLLNRAADFYSSYLWKSDDSAEARTYLRDRGLSDDILKEFRIGFSPADGLHITRVAREAGFTDQELVATGLSISTYTGFVGDRFRSRIMFPTTDERGRVLGFGARATLSEQDPKYINTPATGLYQKGQYLYAMDIARPYAIQEDRAIVVEGYTDVLALHQAGLRETVAVMGTALTEEQLGKLSRIATTIVLALDPDKAGDMALERIIPMARSRGISLQTIEVPTGVDPAELMKQEGPDAFKARLEGAQEIEYESATPHAPSSIVADTALQGLLADLAEVEEELRTAVTNNKKNLINVLKQMRDAIRYDIEKTTNR